jgi:hypothetical protein
VSIFVERRRPAFTPDMLARVGLAWAMIAALLLVTSLPAILAYQFPDPDDTLRLIQVRDFLAGQGWFDVTQYRIDAANGGVAMHWSRLVDLPIAAIILGLRGLIGQPAAEYVALIAVPLLTFGAALLLAGRIAWRLLGDEAAGFACLVMAMSVPVIEQLRPMRIDHHGWQIVCALAVMNALMSRSAWLGGWVAGLVMAIWLSISLEGLPLAAAICGVTALRWLRDRHDSGWFVGTMQGLAVGSAALFAATRGFGDLAQHCDAFSPVHIATYALGAVAATGLARLEPLPRFAQIAGFALIAALGALTLQSFAPACSGSPFANLDPLVRTYWYSGVAEGLPVWRQSWTTAMQMVIPPLVALVACLQLAGRSADWLRRWWQDYAMILAAGFVISLFVARAGAVVGALSAVPLGWLVREWLRKARNVRRPSKRVMILGAIVLLLMPSAPITIGGKLAPSAAIAAVGPGVSSARCDVQDQAARLDALPRGTIFAPLDIGPSILLESHHSVVATSHHRAEDAMHDVIATFLAAPADARATVARHDADYVVMCTDLVESELYANAAPSGLARQLLDGSAPDWLEPVDLGGPDQFRVWRVRR